MIISFLYLRVQICVVLPLSAFLKYECCRTILLSATNINKRSAFLDKFYRDLMSLLFYVVFQLVNKISRLHHIQKAYRQVLINREARAVKGELVMVARVRTKHMENISCFHFVAFLQNDFIVRCNQRSKFLIFRHKHFTESKFYSQLREEFSRCRETAFISSTACKH